METVENIFATLKAYGVNSWKEKEGSRRKLSQVEKDTITSAHVEQKFDKPSVCFTAVSGSCFYLGLDRDASCGVGEVLNKERIGFVTLEKKGEPDCIKVTYE